MRILACLSVAALAACTAPNEPVASAPDAADTPMATVTPVVPTGATLGPDGFATILSAPFDPSIVERRDTTNDVGADGVEGWYARDQGISVEEARERLAGQQAKQDEAAALRATLAREEPDNFLDWRLAHQPDWHFVYYFKRDPQATLARYTSDPRFTAASGQYSQADRAALIEPWQKRWSAEGIPLGYGLDAVNPEMKVSLGITAADYRAMAEARGWGTPPEPIVLDFAKAPVVPAVDPRIAPMLKGYSYERFPTLMQLEALGMGLVTLEDGCLMVGEGADKKVVVLHNETGIGLDEENYLVFIDRHSGKVRGRIGERMAWGAPNAIPEKHMVGLAELRARCPGELLNIGNPESADAFEKRYAR